MGSDEKFCSKCGADRDVELRIWLVEQTKLESARKWILGVGFWYVVSAFLQIAMTPGRIDPHARDVLLYASFGLCGAHILLYMWAKKQPFPAAIVALILFGTLVLFGAVQDPESIYKGIVLKVIFIAVLVKAVQAGYEVRKLRGQRA